MKKDDPIYFGVERFNYSGKGMTATAYRRMAKAHEETYTVVRKDGDHYFFTVSSNPNVPIGQIRDGRYDSSKENCWTLWDTRKGRSTGDMGMTESIKRNWTYPSRQYFLDGSSKKTTDFPIDNRNVIQNPGRKFVYAGEGNRVTGAIEYKIADITVSVPAGIFKNCFEFVETVPRSKEELKKIQKEGKAKKQAIKGDIPTWAKFETHTFWAAGVGMVYEYQKLAGGVIAYELKLKKVIDDGKVVFPPANEKKKNPIPDKGKKEIVNQPKGKNDDIFPKFENDPK